MNGKYFMRFTSQAAEMFAERKDRIAKEEKNIFILSALTEVDHKYFEKSSQIVTFATSQISFTPTFAKKKRNKQ